MATEDELKYTVLDWEAGLRLVDLVVARLPSVAHEVIDVTNRRVRYLDTPDGVLGRAGVGLRARGAIESSRVMWTAKVARTVSQGRFVSEEVEAEGGWACIPARFVPSLSAIGATPPFIEIACMDIRRQSSSLRFIDGGEVEIAVDSVRVTRPSPMTFAEVEFELRVPGEDVLAAIKDALVEDEVEISTLHKLGRALAAVSPLKPDATMAERFLVAIHGNSEGEELMAPWASEYLSG
ncbi:MAG: CYTH domain-containing protein [Ferrimicrobium sp.]